MTAPPPKEFRDDVVAVARKGEAPIAKLAADFGISESCLRNWLRQADVEDGVRPGTSVAENSELREAKRKIRLLEQENEVLRQRALPMQNFPGPRVLQYQQVGVQRLPVQAGQRRPAARGQVGRLGLEVGAVDRIAHQRVSDMGEVDPDLVGAPGLELAGHQRGDQIGRAHV